MRALIERTNQMLHRYQSLYIARCWRAIAALEGYMAVFANGLVAIANMVRLRVRDRIYGIPSWEREGRLRRIAGYHVRRRRKPHSKRKSTGPPRGTKSPPGWAA